ncbi:hypothetical protein FRUB_02949 [Fimbriiglobus ruber]|uniref:Uncharacterized protein n=1 Tax=Fimbriiglobus ruber TaxID=1908690 RepID=A0A225DPE9_9BACT|nr:hypothetical protein FRUB_02949 [Fimbriiglobus ruber]
MTTSDNHKDMTKEQYRYLRISMIDIDTIDYEDKNLLQR